MAIWDKYLSERDKAVYGKAGFGERGGLGDRPALVVVDVNYNFCGDKPMPLLESIEQWGTSCGEEAWDAIGGIVQLLAAARDRRIPVFYSTGLRIGSSDFDRGRWSDKNRRGNEGRRNPRGNDIVDEIAPLPHEFVINKSKPSAFFGTLLAPLLVDLGVDSLIVCGTTTSGCVRGTVIDGFSYNYHMAVVEECTFDRGEASHAINLFDMNQKYADVMSLDETLAYLKGLPDDLFIDRMPALGG